MKSFFYRLSVVAVALAMHHPLLADEPQPAAPAQTVTPTPPKQAKWNIRVEVLMVAMPAEKALSLLPDLRDETKIDAAWAQLFEAIQHKEARLTGYPMTTMMEGQESTSATKLQKIYPTQFNAPQMPTSFELRNIGPQLMAKCQVSEDGKSIQVLGQVERVELLDFDAYDTGTHNSDSSVAKIIQPLFFNPENSSTWSLRNGQRLLVGVHQLVKPEGDIEFFVLQATATALP